MRGDSLARWAAGAATATTGGSDVTRTDPATGYAPANGL
jgi:hypothetical protein